MALKNILFIWEIFNIIIYKQKSTIFKKNSGCDQFFKRITKQTKIKKPQQKATMKRFASCHIINFKESETTTTYFWKPENNTWHTLKKHKLYQTKEERVKKLA